MLTCSVGFCLAYLLAIFRHSDPDRAGEARSDETCYSCVVLLYD